MSLAALNLLVGLAMLRPERTMRRHGGRGIIALEFAVTARRAGMLMTRWGTPGLRAVRASLQLDYLYLVTYAPLLALVCEATTDALSHAPSLRLERYAPAIAWCQLAAGVFDAIENAALLSVVSRNGAQPYAAIAAGCAAAKFGCITAGGGYLIVSWCRLAAVRTNIRKTVAARTAAPR